MRCGCAFRLARRAWLASFLLRLRATLARAAFTIYFACRYDPVSSWRGPHNARRSDEIPVENRAATDCFDAHPTKYTLRAGAAAHHSAFGADQQTGRRGFSDAQRIFFGSP